MGLKEDYDFELLHNETERLVIEHLERDLKKPDYATVCKCQDCVLDMVAFSLNHVRPFYRVSLMGTLYAQHADHTTYSNEVEQAVKEALRKIGKNPSH